MEYVIEPKMFILLAGGS